MILNIINANLAGLASTFLSVMAFILVCSALRKRSTKLGLALLLLFTLLSIPSLLFTIYYFHILPETAWFYTLRSWQGSEFLAIFVGCAGGSAAALLPRFLEAFPLFAVILIAVFPYVKPLMSPLPSDGFKDHWKNNICYQSTGLTCGPASVCTILKHLGVDATEREVARKSFTSGGGTEAWYLARFARSKGFVAKFDFRKTYSPDVPLPALVGVRLGGLGHFIAVLANEGGTIIYSDPISGLERMPVSQFQKRYTFTGFHMIITRD